MGTVWDRAVEFLSDYIALVVPIAIFAIFVPTSISGSLKPLQVSGSDGAGILVGVLGVGFSILQLWGQLAITALAIDPAIGTRANRVATQRLLPAIGIYLLLLAAIGVLSLPAVALLAAGGLDLTRLSTNEANVVAISPGIGAAVALYGVVLLVALIAVGARLMLTLPVVVAERRGIGAIPRAFELSRGLAWKLIGVMILYGVVAIVAILAAQTVFGSILRIVAGGDGSGVSVAGVVTAIAVAAVSTCFTVIATAFVAKLYVAVMRAREAAAATATPAP